MQFLNRLLSHPSQIFQQPSTTTTSPPQPKLTSHLLASMQEEYKAATQSPFLLAAAEGRLSKDVLGKWLAGERLYFHSYIRAAGKLLATLDLPPLSQVGLGVEEMAEMRLVDWVIENLARIRGAEKMLVDVAGRYGIEVVDERGEVGVGPVDPPEAEGVAGKTEGRKVMVELMDCEEETEAEVSATTTSHTTTLPTVLTWLEAAVMFWGTERCYLDAWSWAKAHQPVRENSDEEGDDDASDDADGGALRREFIPSWSSDEFREFVARLEGIIDGAVDREVEKGGAKVREQMLRRLEGKWRSLVVAGAGFWPVVE
ncbi:hypothetical protein GE09DRAFT_1293413 [Coniochaeta sp. 2T2.1]|nr:hypothetical protein GE09DRAFT_1293413 [Coniochaeta sp. 2T2.1]